MVLQSMTTELDSVRAFCRRYCATAVVRGVLFKTLVLGTITLASLSLVQLTFALFPWIALPFAWDGIMILSVTGIAAICLYDGVLHRLRNADAAAMIEKRASLPHPWLSLSLELASGAKEPSAADTAAGSGLDSLVFERAYECLAMCPASVSLRISWHKPLLFFMSLATFIGTMTLLEPSCADFWELPVTYFQPVRATVRPGNVLVRSGAALTLTCIPGSASFPSCRLAITPLDGTVGFSRIISADPARGLFSHTIPAVSSSFIYQFTIGNSAFPSDTVRVAARPYLTALQIRLFPPAYTGVRPAVLSEGQGNFAAYPGTRAEIRITAPFALSSSRLITSDADTIPMTVSAAEASCIMVIDRRRTFTFALADTLGQTSDSVPLYSMEIIPDMPPVISFVKPGANATCMPAMAETLVVEAIDDMGLRSLAVTTRKNRAEGAFVAFARTFDKRDTAQKAISAGLYLDLNRFSLYPGDTLFYWATACDNRTFGPAQCTATDTFFFRVPGFEEIHETIAAEQDATEAAVRTVRKKQDDLRKTVSSLMQSAKNKQSLSWEQTQIAKDLESAVKAQGDSLQKAMESFKQAVDKIKQQQSMPPELLAKMDQVQKEIENLRKQFGDSLLFKMPDAQSPPQVSLHDLRESLEKFKAMLPDLSQRLDNTLKFLSMLKRDSALAKLSAEAQRLAKEQQDIASSKEPLGQCLAKQEKQSSGVDSLLADIGKAAEPKGDSSLFSKNDLSTLSEIVPLQKSMQTDLVAHSLPQPSAMRRMSGSLMSLSENLQNLQSSAMARKLEAERATLLAMAHDALSLSSWQRQVRDGAASSPVVDAGEAASHETTLLQSLLKSKEKLDRLAMVSPRSIMSIKKGYDDAARSIERSLSFLTQRFGPFMSDDPQASLDMLAKAVFDAISDMNNQPQSGGSGAGMMMQALRRLSGKQAMLNAMTGELLKKMLGPGGSEGGREGNGRKEGKAGNGAADEKARQEAQAAQQGIADELKKLADKYGHDAGTSLDQRTRELEAEARRLARQLENPTQDLPDRQDRFLSRMLESTLSQHRQDEGKEDRVSQSAKTIFGTVQQSQDGLTATGTDAFYRLRQRAFLGNFPESYRFSVKNYFDSLGVLYLKGK
jgi:hypothetical protein